MTAMADALPARMTRAEAISLVGDWLVSQLGAHPVVENALVSANAKHFTHGWRLPPLARPSTIVLELYIDNRFPRSPPRVLWVNAPPFPSIPHVEADGFICALSAIDIIDPDYPVGLIQAVLRNVADIIENGEAGANIEDFRSEFRSYWNPLATGKPVTSLLDPSGPSREIAVWHGKHQTVISENANDLRSWLSHRSDQKSSSKLKIERATLLWVGAPLLPNEYPASVTDLRALANRPDIAAEAAVERELGQTQDRLTFVIGAATAEGASFGVVSVIAPPVRHNKLNFAGFRPGRISPTLLAASRSLHPIARSPVERADTRWVHGRDQNRDLIDLLPAKVVLIGCGSLGSPIARLLAQGGVGHIHLVDAQDLQWPNTARHALGARFVHSNKALSLKADLQRNFPSSNISGVDKTWQDAALADSASIFGCDLIVSTLGSWTDEAELNDCLIDDAMRMPTLFAWSEPRAVGGHAVLTGRDGGCLACGLDRHGTPRFKIVDFSEATLSKEPACGEHFQAYGASQIDAIAALTADAAVDYLTGRLEAGRHRMCSARQAVIETAGGAFSTAWIELSDGRTRGGNIEEREWPAKADCPSCCKVTRP